jgi:acylphosphatase
MPIRRHLTVTGNVQGVFFRDSVRREAEKRGVAGWARNCPDGNVEVVLEGDESDVLSLIDFCRNNPGHARVEDVIVKEEEPSGLTRFSIR